METILMGERPRGLEQVATHGMELMSQTWSFNRRMYLLIDIFGMWGNGIMAEYG